MEVNNKGEFFVFRGEIRAVEPGGDTSLRYDHYVFGNNTGLRDLNFYTTNPSIFAILYTPAVWTVLSLPPAL